MVSQWYSEYGPMLRISNILFRGTSEFCAVIGCGVINLYYLESESLTLVAYREVKKTPRVVSNYSVCTSGEDINSEAWNEGFYL